MSNYKEINWDIIRADYVMNRNYPSYDELSKKYDVSKPLIISMANDTEHDLNRGKTWQQQRTEFIEKKESVQTDVAIAEAKKIVKGFVGKLDSVSQKMFVLIEAELDYLIKEQEDWKTSQADISDNDKKVQFPFSKYARISDLMKMIETLYKLSNDGTSKQTLITLQIVDGNGNPVQKKLSDLNEEEFKALQHKMNNEGIINA